MTSSLLVASEEVLYQPHSYVIAPATTGSTPSSTPPPPPPPPPTPSSTSPLPLPPSHLQYLAVHSRANAKTRGRTELVHELSQGVSEPLLLFGWGRPRSCSTTHTITEPVGCRPPPRLTSLSLSALTIMHRGGTQHTWEGDNCLHVSQVGQYHTLREHQILLTNISKSYVLMSCMRSTQSRNLHNLKIALRILKIQKLHWLCSQSWDCTLYLNISTGASLSLWGHFSVY